MKNLLDIKGSHLTVVKHHQNRHKIHRRCTFIHSSHNCKYFCEPTFVYVHIGQDGIIVLNFILSLTLYGSESPLEVKFYLHCHIQSLWHGILITIITTLSIFIYRIGISGEGTCRVSAFSFIYSLNDNR